MRWVLAIVSLLSVGMAIINFNAHRLGDGAFSVGVAVLGAYCAWNRWRKIPKP
jgi:hypothetical protein